MHGFKRKFLSFVATRPYPEVTSDVNLAHMSVIKGRGGGSREPHYSP